MIEQSDRQLLSELEVGVIHDVHCELLLTEGVPQGAALCGPFHGAVLFEGAHAVSRRAQSTSVKGASRSVSRGRLSPTFNCVDAVNQAAQRAKRRATSRLAGAIHSVTWNGKELIDSADHVRQLQSAANFDCGWPFIPEVFNPTEAGSRADGAGAKSSSKLLRISVNEVELRTTTRMAFWLAPGERSEGYLALNDRVLSENAR